MRLSAEKGRLDRTLTGAELELAEAQRQIQLLEVPPLPTQSWAPHLPNPCPCPTPASESGVADGSASSEPTTAEPGP